MGPVPDSPDKGTADERRIAQTLEAGSLPSAAGAGAGLSGQERTQQTLDSGSFPPTPVAPSEPSEVPQSRFAQTLDSGTVPPLPPIEIDKGTADDRRVAQTMQSGELPPLAPPPPQSASSAPPPPSESRRYAQTLESGSVPELPPVPPQKGAGPKRQVAQTLESGNVPPMPPPQEQEGTGEEWRRQATLESGSVPDLSKLPPADPRRFAATYDSGSYSGELVERVSVMWSGKFQAESTPRTSIKAESQSVEEESNLVIKPRVMRDAKAAATGAADYEVLSQLGEGGMGVVLAARQSSIDRTVAVKMLKPSGAKDRDARRKFLSEAVVTGDLEHPNIVPIYDVGKDEAGALFYSMKRVKGTPWDHVISEKSFPENIEILMKVADAVAFAHSRAVVHRDLKPENVMLGDFGEVLLMDWGLALTLGTSSKTVGMAGTPAYMAPEMATGPIERIGIPSDIYLLGAILYEIVSGNPPHTGRNVMECLFAAAKNEIRPTEKSGEVVTIALRAMAADPEDRYASVQEFQEAIRQYQSHSESISLSTRADEDLREARDRDQYEVYARALFGFQEARNLWEGNSRAGEGITEASLAYAQSALRKGDYDLGASLLDPQQPSHVEVIEQIASAQRERDARQQRLKTFKRIGAGLVATVVLVITVAFFWIRAEMNRALVAEAQANESADKATKSADEAQRQTKIAEKNAVEAQRQTKIAEKNAEEARKQTGIAEQKTDEAQKSQKAAEEQRNLAQQAQKKEEYEAYIARIGLAAAKIDENAFDTAQSILQQCPAALRDWEWGRLMFLCTREIIPFDAGDPVDAVVYSPDGQRVATGGWGGTARIWDAQTGKKLVEFPAGGQNLFALAFSPDGKHLAVGTNDRPEYLKVFDAASGRKVRGFAGHRDAVLSVVYSRDGKRLLTSSYDNTARLWDAASGQSEAFRGHEWWVWSAAFSPDEKRIVTACQDGSAIVWSVENRQPGPAFLGHSGPVYTACFSPDGKQVASGGYDKRVLLWDPEKVRQFNYEALSTNERNMPPVFETLEGHMSAVRAVHYSPNGRLLATSANDNTVRVWDVAGKKPLKILRGHAGRVPSCAFSPDGQRVLSGSHDRTAKTWSIAGYEEARVFQGFVLEGHRDAILGAGFCPDGRTVVSASRDRTAKLWDCGTGKEIRQFKEGHEFLATAALFYPDGKRMLTAAVDNTTRIWDVASGTQLYALTGTGFSAAVALSSDGSRLLTGSDDKTARIWDAQNGKPLGRLEGHASEVSAVAISADGRLFFTGDARGRGRLWDAQSGKVLHTMEGHSRNITSAAFLPDGTRVLTASADNTVAQWDVISGKERPDLILKHPDAVASMSISGDGRRVLTTCEDHAVRLWDAGTGAEIGRLPIGQEVVNSARFSPDGRRAVTTSDANTVRLWDLQTLKEIGVAGGSGPLLSIRTTGGVQAWSTIFSPDGAYLLTVLGNEARLWDIKTGRQTLGFSPHGSVASARFSPDGKHVVTGSWDTSARIWNAATGQAEQKLEGEHRQYVNDACFSPDGLFVLTASDDKTACVWELKSGKVVKRFVGHKDRVRSAAFSRDGRWVITASDDETARIWDVATEKEIRSLTGHQEAVLAAAFSNDGTRVVTVGRDNMARLWDVPTGKELPFRLAGHTASVTSAAFSPDGRRVLTGSEDNTVKIWDALTGKEILTLKGHIQEITAVAFSPDGRSVLTGSRDGTLVLWLTAQWREKAGADQVLGAAPSGVEPFSGGLTAVRRRE